MVARGVGVARAVDVAGGPGKVDVLSSTTGVTAAMAAGGIVAAEMTSVGTAATTSATVTVTAGVTVRWAAGASALGVEAVRVDVGVLRNTNSTTKTSPRSSATVTTIEMRRKSVDCTPRRPLPELTAGGGKS